MHAILGATTHTPGLMNEGAFLDVTEKFEINMAGHFISVKLKGRSPERFLNWILREPKLGPTNED